jgi:hypothetical protein
MNALYAFWRYDRFPYLLGSEVDKVLDSGAVKVKGYGGACFKPVKILPLDAGKEMHEELERLERAYNRESNELLNKYKKHVIELTHLEKL